VFGERGENEGRTNDINMLVFIYGNAAFISVLRVDFCTESFKIAQNEETPQRPFCKLQQNGGRKTNGDADEC